MGASIHAFAPMSPDLTLAEEAARWGLPITIEPYTVDRVLEGEQTLDLAGQTFELLHVPGHSPDSLVFHLAKQALAFAGDTLFAQSIGRTDLPGGRNRQLLNAIRSQLFPLPAATRVLPGHGPETTIQQEVASNPYLQ
jgi:hydroxyacylglutathione hydrolase